MSFQSFETICPEINIGTVSTNSYCNGDITIPVVFKIPFSNTPTEISLGIRGIEIQHDSIKILKYSLLEQNVTKTGMDILVSIKSNNVDYGPYLTIDFSAVYYRNVSANPMINPIAKLYGKRVYIRSTAIDAFIRDNNGVIDLSASKKKLEVWVIEDGGNGTINLFNEHFKKYMNSDSTNGPLGHQDKNAVIPNKSIEFTVIELSIPGTFTIANTSNNKIQGHDSFDCDTIQSAITNEDQFEIIIIP